MNRRSMLASLAATLGLGAASEPTQFQALTVGHQRLTVRLPLSKVAEYRGILQGLCSRGVTILSEETKDGTGAIEVGADLAALGPAADETE